MPTSEFNSTFIEWPTWATVASVYTLWWIVLDNFEVIPFAPILLVIVLAFHGSVQHELLHGHPTKSQLINDLLAYPPLAIWYPYPVYKDTHLIHHDDVNLTVPGVDPESKYMTEGDWDNLTKWKQQLALFNMTLLGRLTLTPLLHFVKLQKQMFVSLRMPLSPISVVWIIHELLVLSLLLLVGFFFLVNVFEYIVCAYFAQSVILLRSFYEHRAAKEPSHRSIIMNASLPVRLLFLNNNYHIVHHNKPGMSWYRLPTEYKDRTDEYHKMNGNFIESGYNRWFKKYLFRAVCHPKHFGF